MRSSVLLLIVALSAPALTLRDIDGIDRRLPTEPGAKATVVYFLTHDCPISNRYVPEIGRICKKYAEKGLRCLTAYIDPTADEATVRRHRREYGISVAAIRDIGHELVDLAGATVTPEAAVFDGSGRLAYRGRIDNLYASLGTPRRKPTEQDLRAALEEVLAGLLVSNPRTQAVGCFIPSLDLLGQGEPK